MSGNTVSFEQILIDEAATVAFGSKIAQSISDQVDITNVVLYLYGDLGAGKTTLSRGIVNGFGHQGRVKSPTYTLVEPYELPLWTIYHFDLYRLTDPEELEYMGIRDYSGQQVVCLVEWPQKGAGFLPAADLSVNLVYVDDHRQISVSSNSSKGDQLINKLVFLMSQ